MTSCTIYENYLGSCLQFCAEYFEILIISFIEYVCITYYLCYILGKKVLLCHRKRRITCSVAYLEWGDTPCPVYGVLLLRQDQTQNWGCPLTEPDTGPVTEPWTGPGSTPWTGTVTGPLTRSGGTPTPGGQTNKLKILPFRRATYAGGKKYHLHPSLHTSMV